MVTVRTAMFLALLLAGTLASNAQSSDDFKFGIKVGGNYSNLKNTNGKSKIGLVGGVFMEYEISEKFSLRSEALFSKLGAKGKGNFETIRLNYVNILPVLAKFYPAKNFGIEAGPYGGFLLSKKGGNLNKSNYRKIDYGITLGVGYRIMKHAELGAGYYYGLRDVTKTTGKINNRNIQITLSYSF